MARRLAATKTSIRISSTEGRWFDPTLLNHGQSEVLA
jgi:hypothetical protein